MASLCAGIYGICLGKIGNFNVGENTVSSITEEEGQRITAADYYQDNRISDNHKSCRQRNVVQKEEESEENTQQGENELGPERRERERERRRGKVNGAGPAFFPLISSTPLITMTEGGQEREKVSRETVKFGLMEGERTEGKKRERWRRGKRNGGRPKRARMKVLAKRLKEKKQLKIEAKHVIWNMDGTPN